MYLMINTSEKDMVALSLFDEQEKKEIQVSASNRKLLQVIDSFLTSKHKTQNDVAGVMVVVGQGSFTSTRLSVTAANTFGYVRRIPLLSISEQQATDVQSLIPILLDQPLGQYISATYSGTPNIGNLS